MIKEFYHFLAIIFLLTTSAMAMDTVFYPDDESSSRRIVFIKTEPELKKPPSVIGDENCESGWFFVPVQEEEPGWVLVPVVQEDPLLDLINEMFDGGFSSYNPPYVIRKIQGDINIPLKTIEKKL